MRKWIAVLLSLLLALSMIGAAAEMADGLTPITFPELHFTTAIDFEAVAQVEGYRELFIYTGKVEYLPYFYVNVSDEADRMTDGQAGIDAIIDSDKESYGGNGAMSFTQHGDFNLGGKYMPNVEAQFTANAGHKVYSCTAIDVRDGYTILYGAFYVDEGSRDFMLRGLNTIAENLQYTGGAAGTLTQTGDNLGVHTFSITDVQETENGFGRCIAPVSYNVRWEHTCCTTNNSISMPHRLAIVAQSPEKGIVMHYLSGGEYICSTDGSTGLDGQFSSEWYTPILHYMDASEYCDYVAVTNFPELAGSMKPVSEDTFPAAQQALERMANAKLAGTSVASLFNVSLEGCTVSQKRYSCEYGSSPYYIVVLTAVLAARITTSYGGLKLENGGLSYGTVESGAISWEVPFTYILTCPTDNWAEGSAAFDLFVTNTRASDQFEEANKKLASALWDVVVQSYGLASGSDYSERVLREETANGEDYDMEQVTDYIFDQNDYTLSDGSHVKVSAAYDYVYEGENGAAYYSDSAFAEPGGSIRLYPNQ